MRFKIICYALLFVFVCFDCKAQLCTGSLGDPIVDIDFGSGTNQFGPQLAPGTTNLTYLKNPGAEGSYTIANSTEGMNGGWVTTTDHTGNPGGYMMVINASLEPGIFYTQHVDGLCPGTTYEFGAWVQNILNYVTQRADITFQISGLDGTILGKLSTGPIMELQTPAWKQYALQFTTPANQTSVIITLINNGPGGGGNDLALDDITFRPCGPVLSSTFDGALTDLNFCAGENRVIDLNAQDPGGTLDQYQWQVNTGSGWVNISGATGLSTQVKFVNATAGVYQYRLAAGIPANFSSPNCRVVSDVCTVTVRPFPVARASNNGPLCVGGEISLSASGGGTYTWTGPGGFTSTLQSPVIPNAGPLNAGIYQVAVTSSGCTDTAYTTVAVLQTVTATISDSIRICRGSSAVLTATGGTTYSWSPAAGLSDPQSANPVASPDSTTVYTVVVSNGGCSQTLSTKVNVVQNVTANAGSDAIIISGQTLTLHGKAAGPYSSYYWTPGAYLNNPNSLDPQATPTGDISYVFHVTSPYCNSATDTVNIKAEPRLAIPNTFSPNNYGINDVWVIDGLLYYSNAVVHIYNRYGAPVFESKGYPIPWDGKYNGRNVPAGAYYYVIDLNNGQPTFSGWLLVIR